MIDYQDFREKAVEFMLERGWKEKTAKRRSFEQSLFDHTVIELDALITLLPLLNRSFAPKFTDQEEQVVLMGALLHDVGKELDAWQEYIQGRREFVSDVNRKLAEEVVPKLATQFGFGGVEEILSAVVLHMRHERSQAKVINQLLFGGHTNPRWKTLADIVDAVDNLCSAKGLFAGLQYLRERNCLSNHLHSSYHLVQMRGVSTTLLHRAAIDAFTECGWNALLHYSNGTIYVTSSAEQKQEPNMTEVEIRLAKEVSKAMGSKFAQLTVGSPLQSMIPKADLFDHRELNDYLSVAARRINRASFSKKPESARLEVVGKYTLLVKSLDESNGDPKSSISESNSKWKSGQRPDIDAEMLALHTARIGTAQSEMCIFKFFKAALAEDLVGNEVIPEAAKAYAVFAEGGSKTKKPKVTPQSVARAEYDAVFGDGAYTGLQSTTTLMPARDMALTVDRFWSLDGARFGLDLATVGDLLDDAKREAILVDALAGIAGKVYAAVPEANRPTRATPEEIAQRFLVDLIHPAPSLDIEELVIQQITAYSETKANARKDKGLHLCPICNQAFDGGTKAKADFVGNPAGHTNRAISHGGGGQIVICDVCKFERFLQQLLLGSHVTDILVLFPRMNIGHSTGEILRRKAIQVWEAASRRMSAENPEPDLHLSLGMTYNFARKMSDYDIYRLKPSDIIELMTYESGADTKKRNRKELEKGLRELYGVSELAVEELNEDWDTNFGTVENALEALINNRVSDADAREVRAKAFHLSPQFYIACQTPHMILIPLPNPVTMGNESDTNAGLRELYLTLVLGLALDCSVAIVRTGEIISFEGGEGVARVPPTPALRDLIGSEWIPIEDAQRGISAKDWMDAIGAAALLASSTEFPERSNLYQILKSPTLGHVLRRIEQKSENGRAYIHHFHLLNKLEGVLR